MPLLSLLAALRRAHAAEPTLEEMSEMSLAELLQMTVTSATRSEMSIGEVPATVYLVTDEMIRARGYRTLIEVLQDLPEVQVAFKANEEAPNGVTMRGISGNDKFLLLRDGVRSSNVSGRPEPLLQNYSLAEIDRIEIILGPASALYGADAFAGIVNLITKSGADLQGATISGSYGMYNTTHDSIVWGDQLGDVELMVSAQLFHSDEPVLPDLYADDYAGYLDYRSTGQLEGFDGPIDVANVPWKMPYDAMSVGAKVTLYDLELGYYFSTVRFAPAYSATPSQTTFNTDLQRYNDHREIISLRHRYEIAGRHRVRFDSSLAKTSSWLGRDSGFRNLFTGYERTWKAEWGTQITAQEIARVQIADGYDLTAGLTYDDITGMPKSTDLDRPYDPALPTDGQGALYPGSDIPASFYVVNDRNLGATLQAQAKPVDQVQFIGGLRYDDNRRFGATVNPRAGLVLQPTKALTTKILYGEAFLSPSLFLSYLHYGSFNCTTPDDCEGGFFHVPNPELSPEKLRTAELSTTYAWTDHIVTSVSSFYTQSTNRLDLAGEVTTGNFLGVDAVEQQRSINRGTLETYGGTVRAEAQIPIGALSLRPDVAYTYINGDIALDAVDNGLPNAAPHSIKAGLDVALARLTVAPRLVYLSETLEGQGASVPASWVINLAARYDNLLGTKHLPIDVFLHATNLLDQRFYHAPTVDLGGGFTMARIPQDPLRIDGGASVTF